MTGRSDITRWNRAGLRRFQYVDANAATYLEELRVRLADRFPGWQPIQRTGTEVEQYRRPRSAVSDSPCRLTTDHCCTRTPKTPKATW